MYIHFYSGRQKKHIKYNVQGHNETSISTCMKEVHIQHYTVTDQVTNSMNSSTIAMHI